MASAWVASQCAVRMAPSTAWFRGLSRQGPFGGGKTQAVFGKAHGSEFCMNPCKYTLYHFYKKGLTKSAEDNPCEVRGYTEYDSTATHAFGPVSVTLDVYNLPSEQVKVVETVLAEGHCCQGHCQKATEEKYYALAARIFGAPCGEGCMDPSKYSLYREGCMDPSKYSLQEELRQVRGGQPVRGARLHGV
jgi:hypothetical protein